MGTDLLGVVRFFMNPEHCRGQNDLSSCGMNFPGGQKQMPKACHPKEPNRGMVHFDWGAIGKEVTEMSDQKVVNWAIGELDKIRQAILYGGWHLSPSSPLVCASIFSTFT